MKKNLIITTALGAALFMASCSNEEVIVPQATGDITVTVKTETGINSRALATIPGYELQCTMQLVDESGNNVGSQQEASAASGTASFTILATDLDAGAAKALFWAQYVPTSGKGVYNTADLKNVTYNTISFDLTDNTAIAACDAFAGLLSNLSNGASVTLTRPMIQFSFTPTNPEVVAAANSLTLDYETPSGYNVLTSNTTTYTKVTYTNSSFDPNADPWFITYIIAPANLSTLDKAITMTITGTDLSVVNNLPANQINLDANYMVDGSGELDPEKKNADIDVTVTVDGKYEGEVEPVFELGAYVNAAGQPVAKAKDAVAVVFYVGAMNVKNGTDAPSLYPTEYQSKTIKGYAIALNRAGTRANISDAADKFTLTENEGTIINGWGATEEMLKNSDFASGAAGQQFTQFKADNALTSIGNTTTDWYLPSTSQLQWWITRFTTVTSPIGGNTMIATPDDTFKSIFTKENVYDRNSFVSCKYISSTVNDKGLISGAQIAENTNEGEYGEFTYSQFKTNNPAVVRPMFTIFE